MHHYEGPTPKRHFAYSNSPAVLSLDRGKLSGWKKSEKRGKVKTAEVYKNKAGRSCYKGTPALRKSEQLGFCWVYSCFHDFLIEDDCPPNSKLHDVFGS